MFGKCFSGFGVLNKLVLEFDEVFWPTDSEFFLVAPNPGSEESELGLLKQWMALQTISGRPILMGFISGTAAIESEQLSDSELKEKGSWRSHFVVVLVRYAPLIRKIET